MPLKDAVTDLWDLIRPRQLVIFSGIAVIAINRLAGLALPASTKVIIDDVVVHKDIARLNTVVAIVVVATILQGLTSVLLTRLLTHAAHRLIADTRRLLQKHVGLLPLTFYDETKTGTIISRVMWDIDCVSNLIGTGLVELIGGVLTAAFALIILFRINVVMSVVTFTFVFALGVILTGSIRRIRPMFLERKQIDGEVSGRLAESLAGVRVIKGYHAEEREHQVFSMGVKRILAKALHTFSAISIMNSSTSVLIGIVTAGVTYMGVRYMMSGSLTLGQYCTYTMFMALLIAPVQQVVTIGVQIAESLAGIERTKEILRQRPETDDPRRKETIPGIAGTVEFADVGFAYDRGKKVLHNISFQAYPGTVTALIGPSGAGKSTIIGLLASFYTPQTGRIFVDGIDLSRVTLGSYRSQLGLVLQDSFLFDGSIRDNVAFSRPAATDREILEACRIARVDEFAERFSEGYDTLIGERGVRLSGGQRQRISIARAILADPRILILDEATSSLDTESEALIQAGLGYLMRGRTTFVIAHRLSTIRAADQILVVENGRIIERGSHQALYARGGRYFEMYVKQNGFEQDLFVAPSSAR